MDDFDLRLDGVCEACKEEACKIADKAIAERDLARTAAQELKAELQLVREQTAKAARIMIEETERERDDLAVALDKTITKLGEWMYAWANVKDDTARRAVEVCEGVLSEYKGAYEAPEEWVVKECIEELRREFGLGE